MTDEGNRDADLWANTSPQPAVPPAAAVTDPTQAQPATPTQATPDNIPHIAQPTFPSTGGGAFGRPPGSRPSAGGRSNWASPTTIGLLVGGVVAATVILFLTRSGGDSVQTFDGSTTEALVPAAETVTDQAATAPPTEILVPAIEAVTDQAATAPPTEILGPAIEAVTDQAATAPTTGPALASPGTVRVDGVEYSIERSCFTVQVAPDYAGLQVFSHLISIDGTPAVVEQWFDEGGITGGTFSVLGFPADTGTFLALDQGYAFEAPPGSGDFSIVANPTSTGSECANDQAIRTFGADDAPRYLRALVDVCFISNDAGESTVIGYGSDLGRVEIKGDADGNYLMTYSDPVTRLDGAPAELLGDGSSVSYRAPLADGSVLVTTTDSLMRDCTNADLG